jgi:hypothetical protein
VIAINIHVNRMERGLAGNTLNCAGGAMHGESV